MVDRQDDDGFRDFVVARMASLRTLAYLTCGDWHSAEDAVANALAKLYPRWSGLERPDLYAQTMVYRSAIDETRRLWWRRERASSDAFPDVVQSDPAGAADERMRVRQALMAVPSRQRTVLFLRYYQGLTIDETAQVLACHAGTVKSQTTRGLKRLREVLAAGYILLDDLEDAEGKIDARV